jgi:hypothetical protein
MKARVLWCMVAVAPLIAAGCATHDVVRPGDRTFDKETQPPGSAVAQSPPAAVVIPPPPQPVVVQPSQAPVVVQPPQAPVVVQPPPAPGQVVVVRPASPGTVAGSASHVVQADALEANEVRAQTIYANRIQAPEIRGTIHQSGGVKMDRSVNNLRAAMVSASVLYADTIKADRVIADHIYVREVDPR